MNKNNTQIRLLIKDIDKKINLLNLKREGLIRKLVKTNKKYNNQNLDEYLDEIILLVNSYIVKYSLNSNCRKQNIISKKYYIIWWLNKFTSFKNEEIAYFFSLDRTTIIHAINRIDKLIFIKDKLLYEQTEDIISSFKEIENKKINGK